ncbi:unnamed protein product [Fraxinus pennsylvanica]|uniref:WRKY domain-containing protein n=1 Tax=Fraxinus pennsylvanica TaxID=56036 RepID=A0AAD1ZRF9_9LAMI|nr:unnamed protein product [Fraxinus pennsylvanica]
MDNDWDLYAVVKGCTATASTSTTTPVIYSNMSPADDPFLSSGSMSTFLDDDDVASFNFPSLVEDRPDGAFQGLEEFCKEFCIDPALAAAASGITATTTSTIPVGQLFPSQRQIQPTQEIPQMQPQHVNLQMDNPFIGSSVNFRNTNPQTIRQRRRKNQQMKMVRQMTQEELSADSWAWRKYGQKPIKGSPYPRNYYRCSTSKDCAARKHVERSLTEPDIFVVSYSGEHTHPRPTQRNSLAGSTRNKFSPAATSVEPTANSNIPPMRLPNSSFPSSSLASGSSSSQNATLMEGENAVQNDDVEMADEQVEDEDEDILFQELSGTNDGSDHSNGGDIFSSGLLSPP